MSLESQVNGWNVSDFSHSLGFRERYGLKDLGEHIGNWMEARPDWFYVKHALEIGRAHV